MICHTTADRLSCMASCEPLRNTHASILCLLYVMCPQAVAVLHCLQRLAGHPLLAEQLLNAPGALGRLWACLGCGADHIVAEGARLLVRLFAPAPARHGAPPWRLLRGGVVLASCPFSTSAICWSTCGIHTVMLV